MDIFFIYNLFQEKLFHDEYLQGLCRYAAALWRNRADQGNDKTVTRGRSRGLGTLDYFARIFNF